MRCRPKRKLLLASLPRSLRRGHLVAITRPDRIQDSQLLGRFSPTAAQDPCPNDGIDPPRLSASPSVGLASIARGRGCRRRPDRFGGHQTGWVANCERSSPGEFAEFGQAQGAFLLRASHRYLAETARVTAGCPPHRSLRAPSPGRDGSPAAHERIHFRNWIARARAKRSPHQCGSRP